ncbi:MAG: hypothetical protein FH758_03325 [Firmicutes bacterium]|nr:hypothetical protein [Bacillota bacterium]
MDNKKTIFLISIVFILVMTMGRQNANALDEVTGQGLLFLRKWLEDALYLIVANLSWRWFKKSGNNFFEN